MQKNAILALLSGTVLRLYGWQIKIRKTVKHNSLLVFYPFITSFTSQLSKSQHRLNENTWIWLQMYRQHCLFWIMKKKWFTDSHLCLPKIQQWMQEIWTYLLLWERECVFQQVGNRWVWCSYQWFFRSYCRFYLHMSRKHYYRNRIFYQLLPSDKFLTVPKVRISLVILSYDYAQMR